LHKDVVQMCTQHYLNTDFEGFDTHELKLHDKNTNIWVTQSSWPSLQRFRINSANNKITTAYQTFSDFFKFFKNLKDFDIGSIMIEVPNAPAIEFKIIKHGNYLV